MDSNKAVNNQEEDIEAKAQRLLEEKEAENRVRTYTGICAKVLTVLFLIWSLFQLYANTIGGLSAMDLRAWHILFLFLFTFFIYIF